MDLSSTCALFVARDSWVDMGRHGIPGIRMGSWSWKSSLISWCTERRGGRLLAEAVFHCEPIEQWWFLEWWHLVSSSFESWLVHPSLSVIKPAYSTNKTRKNPWDPWVVHLFVARVGPLRGPMLGATIFWCGSKKIGTPKLPTVEQNLPSGKLTVCDIENGHLYSWFTH
jgi:hypothetical protein